MSWSPENITELTRLWGDGVSAGRIAAQLGEGLTRNAVIGKVHRLGLNNRKAAPPKAAKQPRPVKATRRLLQKTVAISAIAMPPPAPALLPLDIGANAVLFLDARFSQCRYVVNDLPIEDRMICGNPTDGGSWCPACSDRVFARRAASNE